MPAGPTIAQIVKDLCDGKEEKSLSEIRKEVAKRCENNIPKWFNPQTSFIDKLKTS